MKLFFRKLGEGQPMIILHGLFGQSDNWQTLAKQFAEKYQVYTVDLRNHGHSPHSDEWNYSVMSADLFELINDNDLKEVILIGHSLGGKVAMQLALDHPEKLSKLIVADMAPKYYPPHHDKIIAGLKSIDFDLIKTRKEADEQLSKYINDFGTKQFLLKNLYWKDENKLAWRFNLNAIAKNIEAVGETFATDAKQCILPTLFLRGERSKYILDEDVPQIEKLFPHYELKTIAAAGHWIHADQPKAFYDAVIDFIK
jgi:esterase